MALTSDAIFKDKLAGGLKNDLRTVACLKICMLMGSFCPKHIKF